MRANRETLRADNTRLLNAQESLQTTLTTATADVSACAAHCTALGEEHARLETRYPQRLEKLNPAKRSK